MKNLFSLTLFLLLTGRAFAVDGVILINQSIALAGNVTPGDSPGFPVTISVSGSYRLSGNLTVPDANTTAIQISADNVSIDLNGFSIIGPVVCSGGPPVTKCSPAGSGFGIVNGDQFNNPNTNISVFNGTVRGMGAVGIALGANSRITNIQATSNGESGISFTTGIVSSCIVTNNGADGIFANNTFSPSRVVDNVVMGNGNAQGLEGSGIDVGAGSVISGNTVVQNLNGISASFCLLVTNFVKGNTSSDAFSLTNCVLVNNVGF
ncbi:MAG TPA: hypothetical protein VKX49_13700 [Bryobacteraceae bacterium]|nr:hypothetical protein [Bryobacteraceae bacterium]